jgi:hypothetical protein
MWTNDDPAYAYAELQPSHEPRRPARTPSPLSPAHSHHTTSAHLTGSPSTHALAVTFDLSSATPNPDRRFPAPARTSDPVSTSDTFPGECHISPRYLVLKRYSADLGTPRDVRRAAGRPKRPRMAWNKLEMEVGDEVLETTMRYVFRFAQVLARGHPCTVASESPPIFSHSPSVFQVSRALILARSRSRASRALPLRNH